MSEKFLMWAAKRHFEELGYKVRMGRICLDHSEIDGEAVKEDERIAIEVKTPRDDIVRGIGQMAIALSHNYTKAVLVTTRKNGKRVDSKAFNHYGFDLLGVDGWGRVHKLL